MKLLGYIYATSIAVVLNLAPPTFVDATAQSCTSPISSYSACEGICACGAVIQGPEVSTDSVTNECGQSTSAVISGDTVTAWDMEATMSADGSQLIWPNGSTWVRPCTSLCGNGIPDTGEACDDGNSIDDDLCSNQCTCSTARYEPKTFKSFNSKGLKGKTKKLFEVKSDLGERLEVVWRRKLFEVDYYDGKNQSPKTIGYCNFSDGVNKFTFEGPPSLYGDGAAYFTRFKMLNLDAGPDDGLPNPLLLDRVIYDYEMCGDQVTTRIEVYDYNPDCVIPITKGKDKGGIEFGISTTDDPLTYICDWEPRLLNVSEPIPEAICFLAR